MGSPAQNHSSANSTSVRIPAILESVPRVRFQLRSPASAPTQPRLSPHAGSWPLRKIQNSSSLVENSVESRWIVASTRVVNLATKTSVPHVNGPVPVGRPKPLVRATSKLENLVKILATNSSTVKITPAPKNVISALAVPACNTSPRNANVVSTRRKSSARKNSSAPRNAKSSAIARSTPAIRNAVRETVPRVGTCVGKRSLVKTTSVNRSVTQAHVIRVRSRRRSSVAAEKQFDLFHVVRKNGANLQIALSYVQGPRNATIPRSKTIDVTLEIVQSVGFHVGRLFLVDINVPLFVTRQKSRAKLANRVRNVFSLSNRNVVYIARWKSYVMPWIRDAPKFVEKFCLVVNTPVLNLVTKSWPRRIVGSAPNPVPSLAFRDVIISASWDVTLDLASNAVSWRKWHVTVSKKWCLYNAINKGGCLSMKNLARISAPKRYAYYEKYDFIRFTKSANLFSLILASSLVVTAVSPSATQDLAQN